MVRPFVGDRYNVMVMKRSIVAEGNDAVEMALGLLSEVLYRGWS